MKGNTIGSRLSDGRTTSENITKYGSTYITASEKKENFSYSEIQVTVRYVKINVYSRLEALSAVFLKIKALRDAPYVDWLKSPTFRRRVTHPSS
jgi:hypothetical protein